MPVSSCSRLSGALGSLVLVETQNFGTKMTLGVSGRFSFALLLENRDRCLVWDLVQSTA
jgi:hypothetical protein